MKEQEIISFDHYYSPNRILMVSYANKLVVLHCPFMVKSKEDVGTIKKGQKLIVEKTGLTKQEKYVFLIDGKWYYPKYFIILVS